MYIFKYTCTCKYKDNYYTKILCIHIHTHTFIEYYITLYHTASRSRHHELADALNTL